MKKALKIATAIVIGRGLIYAGEIIGMDKLLVNALLDKRMKRANVISDEIYRVMGKDFHTMVGLANQYWLNALTDETYYFTKR